MPNWRGLQDFVFLIEIGGLGDCHRSAANRPEVWKSNACLGKAVLPSGMDDTPEIFHSMKVEKFS